MYIFLYINIIPFPYTNTHTVFCLEGVIVCFAIMESYCMFSCFLSLPKNTLWIAFQINWYAAHSFIWWAVCFFLIFATTNNGVINSYVYGFLCTVAFVSKRKISQEWISRSKAIHYFNRCCQIAFQKKINNLPCHQQCIWVPFP